MMNGDKPGVMTSEFWLTIVGVVVVILAEIARNKLGWTVDVNAILVLLGLNGVYTVSRTVHKGTVAKTNGKPAPPGDTLIDSPAVKKKK